MHHNCQDKKIIMGSPVSLSVKDIVICMRWVKFVSVIMKVAT